MKVIELKGAFGTENLVLAEREMPRPGPGEILLRMKAASLNYRDLLTIQGLYNPSQLLPLIPCSDGVGEVIEVGEGVTRIRPGDRVATTFFQGWISGEPDPERVRNTLGGPCDGVLAEYMVLEEAGVVHVPDYLTDEQAATLPCAALTAWSALVTYGSIRPGEIVLVLGTGGVALFALQFAKLLGARVYVLSSSDAKLEKAIRLGADRGINYKKTPAWGKALRQETGGRGVDHIIELGGAGTLQESLTAIRIGGHISLIGVLAGPETQLNIRPILMRNVRIQGIFVGNRDSFEAMNRALAAHKIEPVIDRILPFEEVRTALKIMAHGEHFGKICLRFPS